MHLSIGRPYFQTDFDQNLTNTLKALSCKAFAIRDEKMLKIFRAKAILWRDAKWPPQHRRRQMNGTRLKSFFRLAERWPDPGSGRPGMHRRPDDASRLLQEGRRASTRSRTDRSSPRSVRRLRDGKLPGKIAAKNPRELPDDLSLILRYPSRESAARLPCEKKAPTQHGEPSRAGKPLSQKRRRPQKRPAEHHSTSERLSGLRSRPHPGSHSHPAVRRARHDRWDAPGRSSLHRRHPR